MPSEVSSLEMLFAACKVSKYGVFSGPYLDIFHAVIFEAKSVSLFSLSPILSRNIL